MNVGKIAVALCAASLQVACVDIYLPCLVHLCHVFNASHALIQFSVSLVPFVSAFVGIIYGHMSDRIGPKYPFYIALNLIIVGSFLAVLSHNTTTFLIARFIQSCGAGGLSVLSLCIIHEETDPIKQQQLLSIYSILFPLTFAIAPVIGACLLPYGWDKNFWFLMVMGGLLLFMVRLYIPSEVHRANIPSQDTPFLKDSIKQKLIILFKSKNFIKLGTAHILPIMMSISIITSSAFLLIECYGYSPKQYSYATFCWNMFNLLGSLWYFFAVRKFPTHKCLKIGLSLQAIFCALTMIYAFFDVANLLLISLCIVFLQLSMSATISIAFQQSLTHVPKNVCGFGISILNLLRNLLMGGVIWFCGIIAKDSFFSLYIMLAIIAAINITFLRSVVKKP